LKKKAVPLLLLVLYAAVTLFTTLHHEPWRDEAQAWLIARDLDLPGIFRIAGYEGHPVLWHLLLVPLAKSGLPILSQQILHWALAVAAVSILLLYSPFPIVTSAALAFSFLLGYEYAVISRNYILAVLLLFAIATSYPRRFERPLVYGGLVFLLFNTIVFSLLWGFSLLGMYSYELWKRKENEGRRPVMGLVLMALGGLAAVLQLIPPQDSFIMGFFTFFRPQAVPEGISAAVVPFVPLSPKILVWPALAILALFLYSFKSRLLAINAVLGVSWLLFISVFKYPLGIRHYGLILIYVVFNLWIAFSYDAERKEETPLARKISVYVLPLILLFSLYMAFSAHRKDYSEDFSTARQMADFIAANNLQNEFIISFPSPAASSILPYLPETKLFFAESGAVGTYLIWNRAYKEGTLNLTTFDVVRIMSKSFPDRRRILLLLNEPMPPELSGKFALLYWTEGGFYSGADEVFYLYKPLY